MVQCLHLGERLEEKWCAASAAMDKCLLKTLMRSRGCSHTFRRILQRLSMGINVPYKMLFKFHWLSFVIWKMQICCSTRKTRTFWHKTSAFSGQLGLKGHKGIMGRYGKMGPSGMKGWWKKNVEKNFMSGHLRVNRYNHSCLMNTNVLYLRGQGRYGGCRSKGPQWRSRWEI